MNGLEAIQKNAQSAAVYNLLLERLERIGPHQVEVKKTSLHITHTRAFLGVHPRSAGLLLNIVTQQPIISSRIKKNEKISANRCHNEIMLASPDALDQDVMSWIKEAYALTIK